MTSGPARPSASRTWLFVLPWTLDSIGGVSEVVRNLMRQVDRSAVFESGLHVLNRRSETVGEPQTRGRVARAIHFREPAASLRSAYQMVVFLSFLLPTLLTLRRYLIARRVSVVNVHYPDISTLYFAVARRLGWIDRLVLSFHGADVSAVSAEVGFRASLIRWSCRSADALVACSHALAARLASVVRLEADEVEVIHNGLDEEACIGDLQDAEPIAEVDDVVLCVASLEHKKGIDVLIDAFARFAPRRPRCRLVVVGRWTPYVAELQARIAQLATVEPAVAARIELIIGESHGRVLRRMESARIVVLPSREEPFGIVILEAGFMGTSVVATAVGGIPEIVDNGINGLLVPADDPAALADACSRLLEQSPLRETLADALARRVKERFTWEIAWQRYLAVASSDG